LTGAARKLKSQAQVVADNSSQQATFDWLHLRAGRFDNFPMRRHPGYDSVLIG